uniref:PEA3-type ETS-domain transcription factor N-terminal domain-containing protein n=2 Tax=Tetraodon nigroviridis TaxID=99883 RepID=H3C913_TETNG
MVVRRKIPTSAVVSSMFPFRETRTQKRAAVGRGGWRPADDRRRKLIKSELALDTEDLFQDLRQLQETWLAAGES